ncbi:MAG: hypothetical protein ACP6IY_10990 [Promethearchaeia archaeon]
MKENNCYYYYYINDKLRCGAENCDYEGDDYKNCKLYQRNKENERKKREYDEYCNNNIKACQTCIYFRPVVFLYEDEDYFDDDLGVFSFWIWEGYCTNNKSGFYRTKSNNICSFYKKDKN